MAMTHYFAIAIAATCLSVTIARPNLAVELIKDHAIPALERTADVALDTTDAAISIVCTVHNDVRRVFGRSPVTCHKVRVRLPAAQCESKKPGA